MPESLSFRFEAIDAGVLKVLTTFDTALERLMKTAAKVDTGLAAVDTATAGFNLELARARDIADLSTQSLTGATSAATGLGTGLADTTPPAAAFTMELARARDQADANARALETAAAATTGLGTAATAVVPVMHTSNAEIVGGAVQAASGLALTWNNGVATIGENYAAFPARLQPANDLIVQQAGETAPKTIPPWQAAHDRINALQDATLALLQTSGDRVLQSVGDTADEIARRAQAAADKIAASARAEMEKLDNMRNFVETQLGPKPDLPFVRFAGDLDGLLKQQAEYIQKMRGLGESTRMISQHSTGYFQSQMKVLHKILYDIGSRINAIQGIENPALADLPEFGAPRDPAGRLLDPPGFSAGGLVPGHGPADSVLARVSPGEFLLPPKDVGSLMDMLSQALRPPPEMLVSPDAFLLPPREVSSLMDRLRQTLRPLPEMPVSPEESLLPLRNMASVVDRLSQALRPLPEAQESRGVPSLAPAVDLPARQGAASLGGRGSTASTRPVSTSGGGGSVVHHHHALTVNIAYTGTQNARQLAHDLRDELLEMKRRGDL